VHRSPAAAGSRARHSEDRLSTRSGYDAPVSPARRRPGNVSAVPLLSALLTLALACTTFQSYPGERRARSERALIEPAIGLPGTQIFIESVDGRALGWIHERAEVLPGRHSLRASLLLRSGSVQRVHRFGLWFDAQPGARYLIFGELSVHGPRLWLTDEDLHTVAEADSGLPSVGAPPRPSRQN